MGDDDLRADGQIEAVASLDDDAEHLHRDAAGVRPVPSSCDVLDLHVTDSGKAAAGAGRDVDGTFCRATLRLTKWEPRAELRILRCPAFVSAAALMPSAVTRPPRALRPTILDVCFVLAESAVFFPNAVVRTASADSTLRSVRKLPIRLDWT
ncbi:MAG: hypothetical protein H0T12_03490, partial [Actinobacteria bacterium]|nr:hypothetical protein [Actinomycetota bacterium]